MMSLLSVVIPAYNVESYIDQCLASVVHDDSLSQGVHVIVVIDGATDATEDVVRAFAGSHPEHRITVIVQPNGGLSAARNTGMDAVDTPYVAFLDGDDFWLPHFLSEIMPRVEAANFDILEFDACLADERGNMTRTLHIASGPALETVQTNRNDYAENFLSYTWARIYRTNLVRRHPFPPQQRFEDTHTTPWFYGDAGCILSLGRPLIAYRQRKGSILSTPTLDDVASLNLAARKAFKRYLEENNEYWRTITLRSFQQACARVIMLPMSQWAEAVRIAGNGLVEQISPGRSWIRNLQVRHTLIYVMLLFVKRNSMDRIAERIRRLRHAGASGP